MPRLALVKSYRLLDSARFDAIKKKRLERTMNSRMRIAAIAFVFAASLANAADSSAPSHSCRKPGKAAEIKTQQEADKFNEAVSKYKSCIEEFVRQQEDAAMIHRRAANEAINEWNDFVTNDMKQ
jgi:hypothetical protein